MPTTAQVHPGSNAPTQKEQETAFKRHRRSNKPIAKVYKSPICKIVGARREQRGSNPIAIGTWNRRQIWLGYEKEQQRSSKSRCLFQTLENFKEIHQTGAPCSYFWMLFPFPFDALLVP